MSSLYRFGEFRLDAARRVLLRGDETQPLTPKAFDILVFLVENRSRVLSKEELLQKIWPDTFVEEGNLKFNVSVIRKALGGESWIETLPRRGYRFAGNVEEIGEGEERTEVVTGEAMEIQERERTVLKVSLEAELKAPAVRWRIAALVAVLVVTGVLGWWRFRPQTEIRSMAVLPFRSISAAVGDREMELGLTDSLIGRLGAEGNWLVRSTGAVRNYAGVDRDPVAAGRTLGVDAVMDGSIQRSADRIRLTLAVLRTSDGRHLWTGKFDQKLTDLFSLEDQIAIDVAQALRAKLPHPAVARTHSESPEVYELYLAGRHYFNDEKASTQQAVQNFELAIQRDPGFAPAYGMLALSYWQLSQRGIAPSRDVREKMRAAATKAIELDESRAEGHVAMAFVKMWLDFDWPGSEKEYRRALELNPNEPLAYVARGMHSLANGRIEDTEIAYRKKLEIDPRSLMSIVGMGYPYMYAGRYDEAMEWPRKALQVDPNFVVAYHDIATLYNLKGMYRQGLDASLKAAALSGASPERIAARLRLFETKGVDAYRRSNIEELLERNRKGQYVSAIAVAGFYNALGEKQNALDWLEKAYDERTFQVLFLKTFPGWAPLRGEPRYRDLLRKMRLAE